MAHDTYAYSSLVSRSSSNADLSSASPASRSKCPRPWVLALYTTILALFVSAAFLATQVRTPSAANCGRSSDEARSLGCHFDVMSFTWSRSSCFDGPLMDEFLGLKNWTWWLPHTSESTVNTPLTIDDVSSGQYAELNVSWEYHLYHCTYMWRKMHRAVLNGKPLDSYVGNWAHTEHCEMMLLDRSKELNSHKTVIRRKFPDCPGTGGETFVG